ncbi:hypothetical protein K438DRAFT_2026838 [Mycena galopus ATCC 62051]|nr:hypothetical protein K438DRAFT_2026838 [Mycena galopus ATCC 62051]
MFKLLAILPLVAFFAGTVVAAPIVSDMSLEARKSRNQAAVATPAAAATGGQLVACTPFDPSDTDFGGGSSPDDSLDPCSIVEAPDCSNDQGIADSANLPLCNTVNAGAPAPPPAPATGGQLVACTPFDPSDIDFGGGSSPDDSLDPCSIVEAPDCSNDQGIADSANLPLCSTVNAGAPAPSSGSAA